MKLIFTLILLFSASASLATRTVKSYKEAIHTSKRYAKTVRSSDKRKQKNKELNYENQFDTSNEIFKKTEIPTTQTDKSDIKETMTATDTPNSVHTHFNLFSEMDLTWKNLNDDGETISNGLGGSILIGYQFPTLFGLEGFEISMRYQPSFLNSDSASANTHTLLAGIGYEYSLLDNLGLLGRIELGTDLPQLGANSSRAVPDKFLEAGFSSQVGLGLRYYVNAIDFNKQLAVGFNVYSNLGSFLGVTVGPSISLFI